MKRQTLGELLIGLGRIDALQLRSALAHQQKWGTALGKTLVEHRFCSWEDVLEALSKQTGHPTLDLDGVALDPVLRDLMPEKMARKLGVVPLRLEGARGEVLAVAVVAPAGLDAIDLIRNVSGKRVRAYLAADDAVERALARLYQGTVTAQPAEARVMPLNESSFELDQVRTDSAREVLLYGWDEKSSVRLSELLARHGFVARTATQAEVLLSSAEEVLLSPLPVMEAMAFNGISISARLIAAGKRPETDAARAFWLGAKAFVAAPLDPTRVVAALRRLFDGVAVSPAAFAA